jgi:hypothetical protein
MKNKIALLAAFIIVAIVSAVIGGSASFMYLSKPFEKWQVQFSETYLPIQAEALQELRAGNAERAIQYLELASTHSLVTMGEQRDEGATVPTNLNTVEAIKYLCDHPPTKDRSRTSSRLTFSEACLLLSKKQ